MARPLRIEYPGAWYHVMNRGAARGCVFPYDKLRHHFLKLIGEVHDRFNIHCHAYCLMGNHYHLLVQTPNAGLARAMRHIDGVYTQRHNRALETDGPLFRGRYKAQLIEDGDYLWMVSRYIHCNPVEAALCKSAADYPWSSFQYFAGRPGAPAWLQRRKTLQQFGGRGAYRAFVEDISDRSAHEPPLLSEHQNEHCPTIIGTDAFILQHRAASARDYEIPESRHEPSTLSASDAIDQLCLQRGWRRTDVAAAKTKVQRQRRALLMTTLMLYTPLRLPEIAAAVGLHYSTAATAISRLRDAAADNTAIATELRALQQLLRN